MFRLPRSAVDPEVLSAYMEGDHNRVTVAGDYVVVNMESQEEGGGEWIDGEGMLEPFLPLREQLLAGDLRVLYLAWLGSVTDDYFDQEENESVLEPPVPPGLGSLNEPLEAFAEFMRVDPDLLTAAARNSDKLAASALDEKALSAWLAGRPAGERDGWLLHLLLDEGAQMRRQVLGEFYRDRRPAEERKKERRSLAQLLELAEGEEEKRKAADARRREAERKRKEEARARQLDALRGQEERLWQEVESEVKTTKPAGYARAVEVLTDLRDLAGRTGQQGDFERQLAELAGRHANKQAFQRRLREAGLR
jgi:hypothetical protein